MTELTLRERVERIVSTLTVYPRAARDECVYGIMAAVELDQRLERRRIKGILAQVRATLPHEPCRRLGIFDLLSDIDRDWPLLMESAGKPATTTQPKPPARQWTGSALDLPAGMRHLADAFTNRGAVQACLEAPVLREFLRDEATTLREWADAVEQLYVRKPDHKWIVEIDSDGAFVASVEVKAPTRELAMEAKEVWARVHLERAQRDDANIVPASVARVS